MADAVRSLSSPAQERAFAAATAASEYFFFGCGRDGARLKPKKKRDESRSMQCSTKFQGFPRCGPGARRATRLPNFGQGSLETRPCRIVTSSSSSCQPGPGDQMQAALRNAPILSRRRTSTHRSFFAPRAAQATGERKKKIAQGTVTSDLLQGRGRCATR